MGILICDTLAAAHHPIGVTRSEQLGLTGLRTMEGKLLKF
jgi:hypothetical protein